MDHDDSGSDRPKIVNVIDSHILRSGMRAENPARISSSRSGKASHQADLSFSDKTGSRRDIGLKKMLQNFEPVGARRRPTRLA
jgi:hypothetical protein